MSCFYPDVLSLLDQSYIRRPLEEREVCLVNLLYENFLFCFLKVFEKIIRVLRYVELGGLSISLTSILISLFIFFSFK